MTRKTRLKAKVLPYAEVLSAIGDVPRLSILYTLAFRPMDVREIIDITGMPGSLMSHHLKVLYEAGWVDKKKYGKRIEYSMKTNQLTIFEKLFKDTPLGKSTK
jgi:DNA-binding transcriptional ArsR family regulator